MVDSIQGLLTETGNFLLKSRAFGDPEEAFRQNTPPGLLDQFDEQERQRLGERLQSRFRLPGSRQLVRKRFRNDVENLAEQEQAAAQLEQFQNNVLNMNIPDAQKERLLTIGPERARDLLSESGSTLGPGDKRLGPLNQTANSNPTSDVQEFQQAQDNGFQGSFQQFQDRNVRTEASPGEAVLDADGNLIFRNPTKEQQNRDAGASGDDKTQRQRQIEDLLRLNDNLNEREATGLVDGTISTRQDPETGRNFIVDEATGTQKPVRTVGAGEPGDTSGTGTASPGIDIENTTGLPGLVRRAANQVTDIIGLGTVAPNTDKARTELNNFNQNAKLLIADSMTEGRRSNLVLEMLDSLTADPASVLQGSENARNQLSAMQNLIDQEIQNQQFTIENEFQNRPVDVQNARRSVNRLNGLKKDLQTMLNGFGRDGQQQSSQDIGEPPQNSGLSAREWRLLTSEERQQAKEIFGDSQ